MADTSFKEMKEMILGSLEPYEGRDPNLSEEVYCKACCKGKDKVSELSRCSRCKLVHYCSRACQKEDFPDHKKACKRIQGYAAKVEEEAAPLRNMRDNMFGSFKPENLFETEVGNFWGLFDTRDYMRARLELANEIFFEIAWEYETKEAWEAVLGHYQEMLRLCMGDNLGLRFRFPFLLLYLNRDDDAFAFVRYWFNGDDSNYEYRESLHAESQVGDWIYGHEQDCRYRDIFQDCSADDRKYVSLALLVAAACIKMRIVAAHEAAKKSMEQFQATPGGKALEAVHSVVSENALGGDAFKTKIQAQRAQLDAILDQIHANNPTMLPALLNPAPLKNQPSPHYWSPRTPSECYSILNDSCRIWHRIPGAEEILQARFGPAPTYNTNMNL